jgi:uncharacterized membrane protein
MAFVSVHTMYMYTGTDSVGTCLTPFFLFLLLCFFYFISLLTASIRIIFFISVSVGRISAMAMPASLRCVCY